MSKSRRSLISRRLLNLRATLTALMPVMTKEVAPSVKETVKVGPTLVESS